jgi:hypothetical protein
MEGVTGMREPIWHERHLVGFGNRLKDRDGVKGKVAESLAVKGRTVAEAMQLLPDAIRYTFQYCEADYGRHLLEDVELTERQGFELVRLRNFWRGDQYKGISSLWRDPATGQLFEVQFHTEISYHAMVLTAEHSYARLRSAQTCAQEEIELEAFQRKVYAHVPVPPGADGFPGYPADAGWQVPGKRANPGPNGVAHYALVDDLSSPDRPAGLLRRSYRDGGRRDEVFTRDLVWHRSSLLISAERGDLENEFIEITAEEADRVTDRIRRSATSSPAP